MHQHFTYHYSSTIRRQVTFKFEHITDATRRGAREYCLCDKSKRCLVEKQDSEKNVWLLFLFHLLFGLHSPVLGYTLPHWHICWGSTLWWLIPWSMRHWWIDENKILLGYSNCTIAYLIYVFKSRHWIWNSSTTIKTQKKCLELLTQWTTTPLSWIMSCVRWLVQQIAVILDACRLILQTNKCCHKWY